MNDLLDAVHALTRPTTAKIIQDTEGGETKLVGITHPALLEQLDGAITGTIGVGGTGSLPNERNMLNAENLYQAMLIGNMVKDWARLVGLTPRASDKPVDLLPRWYVAFEQTPRFREDPSFYIKQMQKWEKRIQAMFNPPRTRDLPDACPVCSADTWWQAGKEYKRPLVLTFHDGPTMIEDGKGMCRACEAVFGLRELSFAIDLANSAKSG